jgi:hypothetical protein
MVLFAPSLRIDDFFEFQSISMTTTLNHQIVAAEWLSFNQKRLSGFELGIPFSMLTRPSLPQPKRAALLTPCKESTILLSFNQPSL